jgi:threonine/homoserine/homoserine lactone efflux protein
MMSIKINISINSGAALIIYLIASALLLVGVALSPAVAAHYLEAQGALTLAFGGYLKKRDRNNVLSLESEKAAPNGL